MCRELVSPSRERAGGAVEEPFLIGAGGRRGWHCAVEIERVDRDQADAAMSRAVPRAGT